MVEVIALWWMKLLPQSRMIFKMGNHFPYTCLIKEMATSCSSTPEGTKSWAFFFSLLHFIILKDLYHLLGYFVIWNCTVPLFLERVSVCPSTGDLQAVRNTASSESRSLPLSSLGTHSPPLGERQLRSSTPDSWSLLADRSGSELFKLSWVRIKAESSSPCEGLLDGNDFIFPL